VRPYLILLLTVPVTGLTGIPMAKLERTLNFGSVAGIELGGQTLGLAMSALFAWSRPGVWAPVAGQLAWQAHVLIAACASARIVPRFRFDASQVREMLLFGVGLTASLRIWQLRTLVNPLLVGRFVGAEGVAFVALALRITEALGAFRLAAGRMAIAALSRLRNQPDKFRGVLEGALYWQVITLGPLLCAFSLLGPFIVRHVIGMRWTPSLTIYPFVAVGVLVNSVYNLQASALFVTGRQWTVMRSYGAHVILLAMGALLLVPRFGIVGYGWSELLACAAYYLIHTGLAESTVISYRKLVPWVAIFIAILSVRHCL
jgi:O-antigen/teichoic acid export membrane protein